MEKTQEGITVKKSENFSEWYTQLITKSELADYTKVSGCIVFRPSSYAIWEKVKSEIDKRFKKIGVQNVYFPLFIPESLLKKEADHIKGFSPEVAWVTHTGDSKLNERLAVRPTSEAIIYDSYSKWIRSWRDLPLKYNQWGNVVRWEFRHPVPFLRSREFLWNEGHTVYATKKEAEAERKKIISIYQEIQEEYMAIPGVIGKKTDSEKFPGAEYTVAIESYLPSGKAIQGSDFHFDGQNFAKAYNIKFLDQNGKEQYVWQNTWAFTTRMLGVMLALHSDDKGVVLPPKIAPNQVVVVPILFKKDKEKVLKKAKELNSKLKKYNSILDDRDYYSVGWKFNEWELKGIPIRIEIGPKDIAKKQVVLVRRDTHNKEIVKITQLNKAIDKILEDMQNNLYNKAKKLLDDNTVSAKNMNEFKKAVENKKIVKAFWCEDANCEAKIKEKTSAKALTIPFDQPKQIGECVFCSKKGKYLVYFGRTY